ncbi:MAG: DUF1653 domain-containing protein [Ruminococcus sp.]|nr:DUF1653 domain-containing protein [Ruminococcus sp.]
MSYINESIIYNIYPLGYCGAPRENDFKLTYRLDKLYASIPHLKSMSINTIVFNPVFESTRHGYDTIDYRKIDSRLGDNQSFKKLCDELHKNGIRVLLDGVFNHVGRDFFAFKDVQQRLWDSPYCGWFQNLNFDGRSSKGDPFWYEGWAGHYDLVKLNLHNPEVVNYLLDSVRFWIDEFGIDGLRLDAADCIDLGFFRELRRVCKEKRPDFWLYGEITHGDYNRWANSETLDSVTNYECYKGLYSSHNDHNYFEIAHSLNRQFSYGGIYQNIYTYNFVDNHDVNRIASELHDKNHLYNIHTMMYTMPGVPSIYYGSEFGIEGRRTKGSDYELRPCLDLDNVPNADYGLYSHIVKLGKVRLALEALKYGRFENVNIMNEKLVYKRFTDNQTVFVMFNLTDRHERLGFDSRCSAKLTDVLNGNEVFEANGWCELDMPPYSSRILVVNDGSFRLDIDSAEQATAPESSAENTEVFSIPEITLGKYRHFKGNEYEVVGFATHSETGEKLVIYKSLLDPDEVWARPIEMFGEMVFRDGKQVPRFEKLG